MLWDSGVWMWFESKDEDEYFHPIWHRFKYIKNVCISDEELEINKEKMHIVADLGEVCTILS